MSVPCPDLWFEFEVEHDSLFQSCWHRLLTVYQLFGVSGAGVSPSSTGLGSSALLGRNVCRMNSKCKVILMHDLRGTFWTMVVFIKIQNLDNYSSSCRFKPVRPSFIFRTQIKIFLSNRWPSIDSNVQKHSKNFGKIVFVTSGVQTKRRPPALLREANTDAQNAQLYSRNKQKANLPFMTTVMGVSFFKNSSVYKLY